MEGSASGKTPTGKWKTGDMFLEDVVGEYRENSHREMENPSLAFSP